jgi:hypothetical protein
MSRRDIDDQPLKLSAPARLQLRGERLEVPVGHETDVRIELGEALLDKAIEIAPQ